MNTLLTVELIKVLLLEPWVQLHLVYRWFSGRIRKEALDFLSGEVGNSDSLGFTGFYQAFHSFVSLDRSVTDLAVGLKLDGNTST